MKRIVGCVLTALIVICLAGCAQGSDEAAAPTPSPTEFTWSIQVADTIEKDIMGITTAYTLRCALTHVGPTPHGEYTGTLSLAYEGDMGAWGSLITGLGGDESAHSGAGINDEFAITLSAYDEEAYMRFLTQSHDPKAGSAPEVLGRYLYGEEGEVPDSPEPAGIWLGEDVPVREGDLGGFWSSGAGGELLGYYSDNTQEQLNLGTIPYSVHTDEKGKVFFTLYSPSGREFTQRFQGTLEKTP